MVQYKSIMEMYDVVKSSFTGRSRTFIRHNASENRMELVWEDLSGSLDMDSAKTRDVVGVLRNPSDEDICRLNDYNRYGIMF